MGTSKLKLLKHRRSSIGQSFGLMAMRNGLGIGGNEIGKGLIGDRP
ncbi:hypothetical protein D082_40090 (plasmid) [Synechocystis sp. PCC 6714]|nr:hypothetical protein D082_40090 [Synechocystis sp. PCC 6714]